MSLCSAVSDLETSAGRFPLSLLQNTGGFLYLFFQDHRLRRCLGNGGHGQGNIAQG